MVAIDELVQYLDQLLHCSAYQDYAPNGLQVAGKKHVHRLVCGVSANQALIDQAVAAGADALLVHHGFFWRGESPVLVGLQYQRISALIKHDINLLAYHLPLDGHREYGNNWLLAKALSLTDVLSLPSSWGENMLLKGCCHPTRSAQDLAEQLTQVCLQSPLLIAAPSNRVINTVVWCTGAGADGLFCAAEHGADAFITGEINERSVAIARELDIHLFAAGHHATERWGVRALSAHCASHFSLEERFIDVANPV